MCRGRPCSFRALRRGKGIVYRLRRVAINYAAEAEAVVATASGGGVTRGADLRRDWRRAFLSAAETPAALLAAPAMLCQSTGKP